MVTNIDLPNAANRHIAGGQSTLDAIDAFQLSITAPGTPDIRILTHFCPECGWQFRVANINTAILVRLLGSYDGVRDFEAVDKTITTNGEHFIQFSGKLHSTRFQFVSESGGTDAVIDKLVAFAG